MFLSEMAEAKQTLIEIRDFDGDAIEDLVKFVYSSRLTLTVDNVQPLLYAACILQVELVAKACCEYMKLHFHPSNCLAVRSFAESHNRIDLMDMADQYACEHFTEVVECEDFVSVSPQHLHKLLSSSDRLLCCRILSLFSLLVSGNLLCLLQVCCSVLVAEEDRVTHSAALSVTL